MRAVAEKVKTRIYVQTQTAGRDEFAMALAKCKEPNGGRWSKAAKAWTYPLDLDTCRQLRVAFGDDLLIGPDLLDWAEAERQREQTLLAHNGVQDIDVMQEVRLPRVARTCPGMWEAMQNRPYQPVASYYMAMARQCLNADQPGIGKTIETLGALIEGKVRGPVLILAPRSSVRSVWMPEIDHWLESLTTDWSLTVALGGIRKVERAYQDHKELCEDYPKGIHFLVVNAEQARIVKFTVCPAGICDGDEDWCPEKDKHKNKSSVRKPYLHQVQWSAIVADETHRWLINTRGKRASQVGYGFAKLQSNEQNVRYALSGTPLKGKKQNLFGTLNWLRSDVYTSKWRWIERNFETIDDGYSKIVGPMKAASTEAFYAGLGAIMIRRTKDELRKIHPGWMPPEKRYHDIWVDLEGSQATHYKAMEKGAEATLDSGTLTATGILAEMTRLKQFAISDGDVHPHEVRRINEYTGKRETVTEMQFRPGGQSGKFEWLLQFLDERGIGKEMSDEVQKVVVASQFTSVLKVWAESLKQKGINVLMITGETKRPEEVTELFQNDDDYRVCLINTKAGGVSITLDRADDMVIMDETWVPDEQEQVEDRIHRASNIAHQVDIWYVRARGTVEEGIAATNRSKAEENHIVLDAKRGLEFAAARFGAVPTHKEDK